MYTQYRYGYNGRLYANYDAIRSGMRKLASDIGGYKIGMPKIGSGKAGGNWDIILSIIEAELGHCDVTIVEYEPICVVTTQIGNNYFYDLWKEYE
jgi:hypothetical protein